MGDTLRRRALIFGVAVLALGCARRAVVVPEQSESGESAPGSDVETGARDGGAGMNAAALGGQIALAAGRHVGEAYPGDCSTFVRSVLAEAGVELAMPASARTGSEALMLATLPVTEPRPGDLAFFHDTYDRNRDRKVNDPYSHVAIVEQVEGTQLTLVHRGGRGIARLRMDLSQPGQRAGNDYLRVRRRGDPPGTRYLAGELSAGFGRVPASATNVAAVDEADGVNGRPGR